MSIKISSKTFTCEIGIEDNILTKSIFGHLSNDNYIKVIDDQILVEITFSYFYDGGNILIDSENCSPVDEELIIEEISIIDLVENPDIYEVSMLEQITVNVDYDSIVRENLSKFV